MQTIGRRMFCGTAAAALPMLILKAQDTGSQLDRSDPVFDILADEITRISVEGSRNGFKAEHFRRYAGVVRTLDAYMETKGINKDLNNKLDDDDISRIDPAAMARITAEFWSKHGMDFRENELAAQYVVDPSKYRELKKTIKKGGGFRALHTGVWEIFERKAKDHETIALKGGAGLHNGRVVFSPLRKSKNPETLNVQLPFDPLFYLGTNVDCLCKDLLLEGSLLAIACGIGLCPPCCPVAATILGLEKLIEVLVHCEPGNC